MPEQDFYQVLGIDRKSSADELKKAYRKLAMQYHPDRNAGDKAAETKFKAMSEAYDVLKDDQKRAAYNHYGHQEYTRRENISRGWQKNAATTTRSSSETNFKNALSRFARDNVTFPQGPASPPRGTPGISERMYYSIIIEGLGRISRDAAARFFRLGGYGGPKGEVQFLAILTPHQVSECMKLWDERLEAAIQAARGLIQTETPSYTQRAQEPRIHLNALLQHLQDAYEGRAELSRSHLQSSQKIKMESLPKIWARISKLISGLDKPETLTERQHLMAWHSAIWDAEHAVEYYETIFPKSGYVEATPVTSCPKAKDRRPLAARNKIA